MSLANEITVIVEICLLSIATVMSCIYIIPIIFIKRFHTTNNILTGNVCVTAIASSLFWILSNVVRSFYFVLYNKTVSLCTFIQYLRVLVNNLLIYSFLVVTINRYLTIIYPTETFFKQQTWTFVSVSIHWLISFLISIPTFVTSLQLCMWNIMIPYWMRIYVSTILIIIPLILVIIFNSLIYISVRSSTRRIHVITTNINPVNNRDIYLLKHMLFIFIVFILGWTPTYIYALVTSYNGNPSWSYQIFEIIAVISAMIIVCDLFFYNRELRRYLTEKISAYF